MFPQLVAKRKPNNKVYLEPYLGRFDYPKTPTPREDDFNPVFQFLFDDEYPFEMGTSTGTVTQSGFDGEPLHLVTDGKESSFIKKNMEKLEKIAAKMEEMVEKVSYFPPTESDWATITAHSSSVHPYPFKSYERLSADHLAKQKDLIKQLKQKLQDAKSGIDEQEKKSFLLPLGITAFVVGLIAVGLGVFLLIASCSADFQGPGSTRGNEGSSSSETDSDTAADAANGALKESCNKTPTVY